jgi:hypothetical protein
VSISASKKYVAFTFKGSHVLGPVTFYRHTFVFTHAHRKTPLEINCTYLGNRKFTAVARHAEKSVVYSIKCHYFRILSISVQIIIIFFINHVIKFTYPPQEDKG